MSHLHHEMTIGHSAFAETGQPNCVRVSDDQNLIAVASVFPCSQTNARDIRYRNHRVVVYNGQTLQCLRVFDESTYIINDLAFHPTRPILAIASGNSDGGGYANQGHLYIWNYQTDESHSLFPEEIEVLSCRFVDDGAGLEFVLAPPWEFDCPQVQTYHQTKDYDQPLGQLPQPTKSSNFAEGDFGNRWVESKRSSIAQLDDWATANGQTYTQRWAIWDIAWLSPTQLAFVSDQATLTIADLERNVITSMQLRDIGVATGLFVLNDDTVLVHVWSGFGTGSNEPESTLYKIDIDKKEIVKSKSLRSGVTISRTRDDIFLARDTNSNRLKGTHDFLFDGNLKKLSGKLNLGDYCMLRDCPES